jgi:hypothetical protein
MALTPETLVAVCDTPDSAFHLARLTAITETNASLHSLGTTNPRLDRAVFKLLWLSPANKTILKDTRPARNHLPITGKISVEGLPDLLVATHLSLTAAGRLSRPSSIPTRLDPKKEKKFILVRTRLDPTAFLKGSWGCPLDHGYLKEKKDCLPKRPYSPPFGP